MESWMNILFLNDWHSVPGRGKPTYLKRHGHEGITPALDGDASEADVATTKVDFYQQQPDVVVAICERWSIARLEVARRMNYATHLRKARQGTLWGNRFSRHFGRQHHHCLISEHGIRSIVRCKQADSRFSHQSPTNSFPISPEQRDGV